MPYRRQPNPLMLLTQFGMRTLVQKRPMNGWAIPQNTQALGLVFINPTKCTHTQPHPRSTVRWGTAGKVK